MLHANLQMHMSPGGAGGEKRRLSIACALIARPSLLFLDEPTTGLDSFAALNIMEHLSSLAALGHAIVASIHQPRSAIWDMFHKVCASAPEAAV
jgi:ABC-type multidrug transport system ATPase subunit